MTRQSPGVRCRWKVDFRPRVQRGSRQTEWDTRDFAGKMVSSGVYFAAVVNTRDGSRRPRGSVTLHVVR